MNRKGTFYKTKSLTPLQQEQVMKWYGIIPRTEIARMVGSTLYVVNTFIRKKYGYPDNKGDRAATNRILGYEPSFQIMNRIRREVAEKNIFK